MALARILVLVRNDSLFQTRKVGWEPSIAGICLGSVGHKWHWLEAANHATTY